MKRLASDLTYVSQVGSAGTGNNNFEAPTGIVVNGSFIYVSDDANDRIQKRNKGDLVYVSKTGASGLPSNITEGAAYELANPGGICSDGTYLYLTDGLGTVKKYTFAGGFAGATFDGLTQTVINDAAVVTNDVDRLAINLVGVNDDNALVAFAGMTGGTWVSRATYVEGGGTDAALQLQTAAMATAGTVDGGSQTMALSDSWAVCGFALIGTTVAEVFVPRNPAINHSNPALL
jgi:hypothetical protein